MIAMFRKAACSIGGYFKEGAKVPLFYGPELTENQAFFIPIHPTAHRLLALTNAHANRQAATDAYANTASIPLIIQIHSTRENLQLGT
jgi:hypothetical protein